MNKFERAFIKCLEDGVYPSPSNINERKEPGGRRFNRLNGKQSKQRVALMYEFGIPYQRGVGSRYTSLAVDAGEIPEYPYLTDDDFSISGIKKPEQGYRKHEFLHPDIPWKLGRK